MVRLRYIWIPPSYDTASMAAIRQIKSEKGTTNDGQSTWVMSCYGLPFNLASLSSAAVSQLLGLFSRLWAFLDKDLRTYTTPSCRNGHTQRSRSHRPMASGARRLMPTQNPMSQLGSSSTTAPSALTVSCLPR
jgi:hypothetical protein